mgnify:CR=1 FL=1
MFTGVSISLVLALWFTTCVSVLGTGVPRLASLWPAAWLKWLPSTARLHQYKTQDPHEGPSLVGRTMQGFLGDGLARQAREEPERSRQGTSPGARDASHDDRYQAGVRRAPAYAVSLFPLWCKGGKHRRGVPRHQAKVEILVQRDRDQRSGRMEVTVEPKAASSLVIFGSRRPTLVRITCTGCSPSKWPLLAPFPLNIWEEARGLYK